MRIAVIGAGAVGATLAALLDRDGHDLEITARGEHLAAIRSTGIRLGGAWGEHTARVAANDVLSSVPDLVIVATKAPDAADALNASSAVLAGVPVIIVQNGLAALSSGGCLGTKSAVVGALALFAASYVNPGQITVTAPGAVYLGVQEHRSEVDDRGLTLSQRVLGAVLPARATENFRGAQWTKLVVNQINALPAITGLSAQAVIADLGLRRIMVGSMQEAVCAGLAAGIRFETLQGLSHPLLRLFASAPFTLAQLLPLAMARRMGTIPNPGSTLQSIRRGQLTEIDYLNGAVASEAARLRMDAAINERLVRLVHEVERSGRFFSPAELTEFF
ncbi:MAG: ketopantoate reductase family protein [Microbacteriaceae bacterium]|nr:ketopantoate reductase family protein [Microbacteriaceae bacterium]